MINFSNIGAYAFTTELDTLQVTASAPITVSIYQNGTTVMSSTYTPSGGVVTIYHLNKLLEPLITDVMADFVITAGSTSKTVHVVRAGVLVNENATTFLPAFFLSMAGGQRDTRLGRHECVTLVATEGVVNVTANCTYVNGTTVNTATKSVATSLASGGVHTVDVSPALFTDSSLGTLVSYEVVAGNRSMLYRLRTSYRNEVAMIFRNAFNAWETFYLPGSKGAEPEYTRESSFINGVLTLYNINETEKWVSHTDILRPAEIALAHDLARSKHVFLLDGADASDAIVITDVDVKTTGDFDENVVFSFTWRRATLINNILTAQRPPQLFDDTFDETYN